MGCCLFWTLESTDGVNEVAEGAAQPVQPPDNERIAWSHVGECLVKSGSVGHRAADGIGEDFTTACSSEGVFLQVEGLVCGGYPRVAYEHRFIVPEALKNRKLPLFLLFFAFVVEAQDCFIHHPCEEKDLIDFLLFLSLPVDRITEQTPRSAPVGEQPLALHRLRAVER